MFNHWRRAGAAVLAGLALMACEGTQAGVTSTYCERQVELSAAQQDRMLRFGALIKSELDASGQRVALISRAGLNLRFFGLRYSHAGLSLRENPNSPWSVRQLYYACEEGRPRIFDQGLAGFVYGADSPELGYVSVLLLPPEPAAELERAGLDSALALALLGPVYSANAYAFNARYQNCNQWVAEVLAAAWGGEAVLGHESAELRPQAQRWLADEAYEPSALKLGFAPLMWVAPMLRFVHSDDHPKADLSLDQFRVSMPESIERFVQRRLPETQRLEFCHNDQHMVVHQGWTPIAPDCQPQPGDRVIPLN
jgi:hypothetical protein